MVRGSIQGICITNLFSGSYSQDSGSHVRKSQVTGCQFQGLACQSPMSQGQNSRVTGPRFLFPTSQSQGPQSQVLVLCHILSVLQDFCQKYMILVFTSQKVTWLCRASGSIIHEVTGARGAFIPHFSSFCKNKIDNVCLA